MRLGLITTSFPRSAGEPAGSFVAEHAQWLRAQGHSVDILAAGDGRRGRDVYRNVHRDVHRVDAAPGLFYAGGAPEAIDNSGVTPWQLARFSVGITAAVARRQGRWDAIIAHWLAPSALAAALVSSAPLLAIAHSGDVHLLARRRLATAAAALLRSRGATIVFVSGGLRAHMAQAVANSSLRRWILRMPVQAMGIHTVHFAAARAATQSDRSETRRLLFLGRLVPIKGVHRLLRIVDALPAGTELVIAGDGPQRSALQAQAAVLAKRACSVRFVGEVRGATRDGWLAWADVVAIPSVPAAGRRTEGTPVVALEAMAAGAALVVSRVGGLGELPAAAVVHVLPDDDKGLAVAITQLLLSPSRRDCYAKAASCFAADHDWSVVGPRLFGHLIKP